MKNIKLNSLLAILITLFISSCSTDFIEDKRELSSVTTGVFTDEVLANGYINWVYYQAQPEKDKDLTAWSRMGSDHGSDNIFAVSTDEKAGENDINTPYSSISFQENHCLKSFGKKLTTDAGANNAFTRIRNCNTFLDQIDNYDVLSEDFVNGAKGQMYYWRAWQYFELVRLYGGVPIILTAQDPTIDDPKNQTPRSTSGEVVDQIVADLEMAEALLPKTDWEGNDYGRVTAMSAAALKGRVLLTWASPLFNRAEDQARWQRAYDACKNAYDVCIAGGKGLNPNWKDMWFEEQGNPEAITVVGYNNDPNGNNITKNNANERKARSRKMGGDGSISPTKNAMDAFPMKDGTAYNPNGNLNDFYKDRDPRFYYTFSYNGAIWPYKQDQNYKNWTYFWQTTAGGEPEKATEGNANSTGVYLRKFTDDNFNYDETDKFRRSGMDYMEFRFAEVVLNLAEAAIGIDNLSEGKGYLEDIRERAGIENNDGQYGLSTVSSKDEHFAACINERRVELAYENKRFHDLRRWLLFDDTFGTLTRLNQTPINGSRRQGYYTIAKTDVNTEYVGDSDPFKGAILDRDTDTYPTGVNTYEEYVDYLYDNHFEVVVRDNVDDSNFTYTWYNEYYFFGIHEDVLKTAPYLKQTQGWGNGFGAGVFDPLAE